jgi:glycosyltransferase involved in cell wall biosynthesis|uniref:glycosyltransferase n=1 Tax=uncultured Sphingomonas sp. TaxID=158754 RepID=UPI0035CBF2D6
MTRIIAYDMCRLFIGPNFATPRGIDRVDFAMANHLFADPDSSHIAILPTPLGIRAYPAPVARALLRHLHGVWRESPDLSEDARLTALVSDMISPRADAATLSARRNGLTRTEGVRRSVAMLREIGWHRGRPAVDAVPADSVYVNLGQLGLAVPMFFTWLQKRPDVACALMIHDTIPLDHPELVKPGSVAHHAQMVRTAATRADCLIFSTAFARASVNLALAQLHQAPRPSLVRALPVPAAFAEVHESLPELSGRHYFVAVSTIEPRKNFTLLLRVWERLIVRLGAAAPHLVIVGAPGHDANRILAPLATSPGLREHVHPVSGLSSPALARLVLGGAGLLSPSLAEGFGLPLLEGIAMGVPTIASDIASHREIAHPETQLLGINDQVGWERAILALPRVASRTCPHIPLDMTEAAYCADILAFLGTVTPKSKTANSRVDRTEPKPTKRSTQYGR